MVSDPFSRSPGSSASTGRLRFGPFRFDRRSGLLVRDDQEIQLPPRALAVLQRLLERPGEVVSKDALVWAAWEDVHVGDSSLSEAVGLIRQALGDDAQQPRYVQTVHRRGYRFVAPVTLEGPGGAAIAPAGAAGSASDGRRPVQPGRQNRWPSRRKRAVLVGAVAALAIGLIALAALLGGFGAEPAPDAIDERSVRRFVIAPPTGVTLEERGEVVALSPDGRSLVFVGYDGQGQRLYLRPMASVEAEPLPGTEGAYAPFFSPDGAWLAFFDGRELKKLALDGPARGAGVQAVADAPKGLGGAWGRDGRIVFADRFRSLKAVDAGGGPVERLAAPDSTARERAFTTVERLPDGRRALLTVWRSTIGASSIDVLDLETGERRELVAGAIAPRIHLGRSGLEDRTARLLYVTADGLVAAPFDPEEPAVTGPAELVTDAVAVDPQLGVAQYAVSGTGDLVYAPSLATTENRRLRILRAERSGPERSEEVGVAERFYRNLAVSPDHERFAVTVLEPPRSDIWVGELGSGTLRRLTYEAFDIEPIWSPDGRWVAFASDRDGSLAVYRVPVDGDGGVELLSRGEGPRAPMAWSPDGGTLALVEVHPETGADLWLLDVASGEARPFLATSADESSPAFSPDGRWLAYSSDDSGRREIYVRSVDGRGPWQLSANGAQYVEWRTDGRSLLLYRGDQVFEVAVAGDPPIPEGPERRVLSDVRAVRIRSLGGDTFLAVQGARNEERGRPLHLVLGRAER